jgi:hypothetical protein
MDVPVVNGGPVERERDGSFWNIFRLPEEIKAALEEAEILGARRILKRCKTLFRDGDVVSDDLLTVPRDKAEVFYALSAWWESISADIKGVELDKRRKAVEALNAVREKEPQYVSDAATPEPPPVGNGGCVLDRVLEDLENVRKDLINRADQGKKKYGTVLRFFNGRNSLMDAYQEALDLVMYLRQAVGEQEMQGHTRCCPEDE